MSESIEMLVFGWQQNFNQAMDLLKDAPADQMTQQPGLVANHPAWTLAHLSHYHPAILSLARGEAVADPGEDPKAELFDAGSTPTADPSSYPTKDELLAAYAAGHRTVEQALHAAPAGLLDHAPGLERWRPVFNTTGRALTYLMIFHEAVHLGELLVWKRAMEEAGR